VIGKVTPESVNPVPETIAALTVTGAVPVDVRITCCVDVVFTVTLPNGMVVALMFKVDVPRFNCTVALAEIAELATLVAVTITVWAVVMEAGAV
jgi:hypothetical protein